MRRWTTTGIILATLLLPCAAHAMKQKLLSGRATIDAATKYFSPSSTGAASATENKNFFLISSAGTLRNLYVVGNGNAAGSGTLTITVRLNGVDQALTAQITNATHQVSDTNPAHAVSVSQGDLVTLSAVQANSPGTITISTVLEYESSTANVSILGGGTYGATLSGTGYIPLAGEEPSGGGSFLGEANIAPTAGTFSNACLNFVSAPVATSTRTCVVYINDSPTTISVAVADAATANCDNTHTAAVSKGDRFAMHCTNTVGTPAASIISTGIVFSPTNDGEFMILALNVVSSFMSTSSTTYQNLAGSDVSGSTEANVQNLGMSDFQITGVSAWLNGAPGTGTSYTFSLRDSLGSGGDASVPFTITISDAATTGSATGTFTPSDWSLLDYKIVPATSPTARADLLGAIGFIAPAGATPTSTPTATPTATPVNTATPTPTATNTPHHCNITADCADETPLMVCPPTPG